MRVSLVKSISMSTMEAELVLKHVYIHIVVYFGVPHFKVLYCIVRYWYTVGFVDFLLDPYKGIP